TGHTDIRPYPSNNGYTNWELSADRANAARRALTAAGLPDVKVSRVVGLSSSVLFDKQDPQSPVNRRISIVVMTKQAEEAALKTDTAPDAAAAEPAVTSNQTLNPTETTTPAVTSVVAATAAAPVSAAFPRTAEPRP